jgi:hypothetical protein
MPFHSLDLKMLKNESEFRTNPDNFDNISYYTYINS